jgi:molybdopterin/thiamine biosynthesis adenylyltransferase
MDISEIATTIEYVGATLDVIADAPLLEWARGQGLSPWEAQLQALRGHVLPERYLRNFHTLDFPQQLRLGESKLLICGCGGLGGVLINLLARAGVGWLRLVDGDVFAPTNYNRQWFCEAAGLARPKVHVIAEHLEGINPFVRIEAIPEVLLAGNASAMMEGIDLVLDALDNIEGRFLVEQAALQQGLPYIHAAVAGWWGQVATFLPDSPRHLTNIYSGRRTRDPSELKLGILGTTAAVIGSLQAAEAIRLLIGRQPAYAGSILYFDGESGCMEIIAL